MLSIPIPMSKDRVRVHDLLAAVRAELGRHLFSSSLHKTSYSAS